jgi:hypothetical protein
MLALAIAMSLGVADWSVTFTPEAAQALVGGRARVFIALAGDGPDDSEGAVRALAQAVRKAGSEVRERSTATGTASLTVAALVLEGASSGAEVVATVRLFVVDGARRLAVVTVYDARSGEPVGGLAGYEGQPAPTLAAALGPTERAARAVADVTTPSPAERRWVNELRRRYVGLENRTAVDAATGNTVAVLGYAYVGDQKDPLEGAAFYEYVGALDLADSYRRWRAAQLVLRWGGLALDVAGLSLFATRIARGECSEALSRAARNDCETDNAALSVGGALLAAVGTTAFILAQRINPHPIETGEVVELAKEFNEELRRELEAQEDL